MKNITKKQKMIFIILAVIIIAGIAVISTIGFNLELKMQETKKIELYIQKDFEISDIKNIVKEVIPDESIIIQKVEVFEDSVSITAKDITDEQKQSIIDKVNEKYGTDISTDDITIEANAHIRGRDIVKPYIVSFAIATVIVLVYLSIRYYKLNSLKVLAKSIGIMLLAQLILLAIIAIARIPIGVLTMPVVLLIYVLSTYICTTKFDKDLDKKLQENN